MKLYYQDKKVIAKHSIYIIIRTIKEMLKKKDKVVLGIPGGRSVKELFHYFKLAKNMPWEKIHIFWVDDRLVTHNSKDSNYKLANDSFISILIKQKKISKSNIHSFNLNTKAKDKGVKTYTKELKEFGGFDIVIFGVGEDGHVGALYPEHHSVKNITKQFITMDDSPKPPPERMTGSRKLFLQANTAIVLFIDEDKRDALKRYQNNKLSINQCPVKLINKIKNHYVLTNLK
jgi:6-phosphogluconolactonase